MHNEYKYPLTSPYFDEEDVRSVAKCLESGWVTQGPMTLEFERLFMKKHGGKNAIAVSSCTAGLHIAMLALGVQAGDEVIVPSYTWISSANCIEYVGAKAVFVDIDKNTYNIDPNKIVPAITEKTKAIVVVHQFGRAAPIREIMEIARLHNLKVIEDCACAIGTCYDGQPVGTFGDVGCFSFHPRKAITTGEGGLCITDNDHVAATMAQLRSHGLRMDTSNKDYGKTYYMGEFDILGYNLRLSDIQASIGLAQMEKLEPLLQKRKECALYYIEKLQDEESISCPQYSDLFGNTFQSFVILLKDGDNKKRNLIIDRMRQDGIQTKPGAHAVHRLGYYKNKYHLDPDICPQACLCEDATITLPIFPNMTREHQQEIIASLLKAMC